MTSTHTVPPTVLSQSGTGANPSTSQVQVKPAVEATCAYGTAFDFVINIAKGDNPLSSFCPQRFQTGWPYSGLRRLLVKLSGYVGDSDFEYWAGDKIVCVHSVFPHFGDYCAFLDWGRGIRGRKVPANLISAAIPAMLDEFGCVVCGDVDLGFIGYPGFFVRIDYIGPGRCPEVISNGRWDASDWPWSGSVCQPR